MIALGCDHGGYALMQEIKAHLDKRGLEYKDFGTYSEDSCDYPVFASRLSPPPGITTLSGSLCHWANSTGYCF